MLNRSRTSYFSPWAILITKGIPLLIALSTDLRVMPRVCKRPVLDPASIVLHTARMSDTQPPPRLQCLDAYRGFIMLSLLAGGIFSTLKGHPTLNWLAYQTDHLPWEGCTFWDLIPSFTNNVTGVNGTSRERGWLE
jgi:hypothetical protein